MTYIICEYDFEREGNRKGYSDTQIKIIHTENFDYYWRKNLNTNRYEFVREYFTPKREDVQYTYRTFESALSYFNSQIHLEFDTLNPTPYEACTHSEGEVKEQKCKKHLIPKPIEFIPSPDDIDLSEYIKK